MTVVVKDRQKALEYHAAIQQYEDAFVEALVLGVDMELLNRHTLPINVCSPKLIGQYRACIVELLNEEYQKHANMSGVNKSACCWQKESEE